MHFQTGYLGRSLTHILVSVAAILQSQATKLLKLSLTKSYTIQVILYKTFFIHKNIKLNIGFTMYFLTDAHY